ncbi:MAG: efflux RND transporter periplasmic adaptor subunit [Nitrospinota bacterium]|nr:efflux RND transporter periplasmic adaptor subunit [Nitrospinota bacterium]
MTAGSLIQYTPAKSRPLTATAPTLTALVSMALAGGLAMGLASCSSEAPDAAPQVQEKKVVRVNVMEVVLETFEQKLTLPAAAKASREVTVASETLARVEKVGFEKGDEVAEGTPLAWLDDSGVRALMGQAAADRDIAQLDYEKQKALRDKSANVSDYTLQKARLALVAAEARLEGLSSSLKKHVITAPISGVAVSRNIEVGAVLSPGAPVTRILTTRPLKVLVGAPESTISDFALGKKGQVVFDAFPDRAFEGIVTYVAAEVGKTDRVFEVELTLPNSDGAIRPEMAAKVTFVRRSIPGAIVVPQTSIVELATGHVVFVVDRDKKAHQTEVVVGDYSEGKTMISSGLAAGDMLVVMGQRGLVEGDTVETVE